MFKKCTSSRMVGRLTSMALIALLASAGCGKKTDSSSGSGGLAKGDTPTDQCAPPKVLLVIDKSSSMVRASIGGKTLWEIAKDAIGTVVNTYQSSVKFGLMMFPTPDKCQPGTVTVMPADNTGAAILAQLTDPPPQGGNYTPMSQSLDGLANLDEMKTGNTHVLLITDGWQWCDGADNGAMRFTPVNSVATLKSLGVTTHVVGFGSSVDVLTLNRMSDTAGTKISATCDVTSSVATGDNCYYQANDPTQLVAALQTITAQISDEICDGQDNNCNNVADEGLDQGDLCDKQDGVCAGARSVCGGVQGWVCGDGVYAAQAIANGGTYEAGDETICDGKDNDCDGQVDENCACQTGQTEACGSDVGECAKHQGTKSCVNGQWSDCVGDKKPGADAEICDGLDNDCNNQIDEIGCQCLVGQTDNCGTDIGECVQGTRTCGTDGKWGACLNQIKPNAEACDGRDNDCNGQIDDNIDPPKCANQVGVCHGALMTCGGNAGWKPCTDVEYQAQAKTHGATYEDDESACDNFDNDCDGTIDEGCDCMDGQVQSCGNTQGICQPGTQACMGGKWGQCQGGLQPSPEICDSQDNDCNGQTDESLTQPCSSQCGAGSQTCNSGVWGNCSARAPSGEVCDGLDNDCDGTVDGVHIICANGGVCLNARCTPREQPDSFAMTVGGGLACQIDGAGGTAALPTLLLLGLLLVVRRRRG